MLGGAAGVAATAAMPAPAWAADAARPGALRAPALRAADRAIVNKVSSRRALRHIEVLSEDIGPRIGGTASERAAADYLAATLDGYGYDTGCSRSPSPTSSPASSPAWAASCRPT